jgi:multiple sugar transport system permease protein
MNSIILGLGGTAYTMVLVVPAAYAISRVDFSGKNFMIFLLLLIQMFSPVIIIVPLYQLLERLNLIDSITGLVLVNSVFAAAFSAWLLSGFFEEIPKDLEKAAIMDGCSSTQILRSIFIPLATPGLVVTAIYIFIWIFNEFLFAFTFMSSNKMQVFVAGIYQMLSYNPDQNLNWSMIMMAGLESILPVTILFMAIRRYLIRGLMSGAVKM